MDSHVVSYRDILKNELADRIADNPRYSLRAMANQAKISASLLSELIRGRKQISTERAYQVAQSLKFDSKKCEYFATLVQFETTKSLDLKEILLAKINELEPQARVSHLSLDVFRFISDWYHAAILEMTYLENVDMTPTQIAKRLKISKVEVETAIDRLLRLKLLEKGKNKGFKKVANATISKSPIPNLALRKFHEQMLKKAIESLSMQNTNEKFIGSETFAFDESQLKEANEIIEECFTKILRLANEEKTKKKNVYHLGIQMFRLTENETGTDKENI